MTLPNEQIEEPSARQPIFNVPFIIIIIIALLVLVHAARINLLTYDQNIELIFECAFIPARYSQEAIAQLSPMAIYWSPVSYSLLHADWTHVLLNSFWLLAFGGVVARRIQIVKFIILCILGSVGGAALHYAFHMGEVVPMIGASASVSACIGAAVRFAFPKNGYFAGQASFQPTQSLIEAFSNRQVVAFVGIWFAINLVVGSGLIDIDGSGNSVAWQAHIGGFLVGLLMFDFVDNKIYTTKL